MLVRLTAFVFGATLVGTLLAHVGDAHACSCAAGPNIRPNQQDIVPLNTKVWLTASDNGFCSEPTLSDTDGNVIAATAYSLEPGIQVLSPNELLVMGSTYYVDCNPDDEWHEAEFTVSAPVDDEAPATPSFEIGEYSRSSEGGDSCGPHEWVALEMQHSGDLTVLDVAGRADLDPVALTGSVVDMSIWVDDTYRIGEMACTGNWNFAEDGPLNDVRVASFDLAGNFSGWSTTTSIDIDALQDDPNDEEASGCACSTIGPKPGGAPWLPLAALALVAARRAHRRRRLDHARHQRKMRLSSE
jgi:MYXO-CTERM domain-containing protein